MSLSEFSEIENLVVNAEHINEHLHLVIQVQTSPCHFQLYLRHNLKTMTNDAPMNYPTWLACTCEYFAGTR